MPHCCSSCSANRYLALITQMNSSPLSCSNGIGSEVMMSSESCEYPSATPRVGLAVASIHGGSVMITSNSRPLSSFCFIASFLKSNCLISARIGTQNGGTTQPSFCFFFLFFFLSATVHLGHRLLASLEGVLLSLVHPVLGVLHLGLKEL